MKTLVFGSLNLDKTFFVDHIAAPGETIRAEAMRVFTGGKGFNQAVALARAGSRVDFAGAAGPDGGALTDALEREGISTRHVLRLDEPTGQAIIQVDRAGQNCIIILPGANGKITCAHIDAVLSGYGAGDLLVVQNEIANLPRLMERARQGGMRVAMNPSPYRPELARLIPLADILLVNEVEGAQITGEDVPERMLDRLREGFPGLETVLTLGPDGAWFQAADGTRATTPAFPCEAVDTTAAGDTFTGYFLTLYLSGATPGDALRTAACAAAIAVSRPGAAPSIPHRAEVEERLAEDRP